MITQFRLENFRCFKKEQELSMIPSKEKSHDIMYHKNMNHIKTAIIFGNNTCGKTALIDGMRLIQDILNNYHKDEFSLDISSYNDNNMSVEFEIVLYINDFLYAYGVTFDPKYKTVNSEYLIKVPSKDQTFDTEIIFERVFDEKDNTIFVSIDEKADSDMKDIMFEFGQNSNILMLNKFMREDKDRKFYNSVVSDIYLYIRDDIMFLKKDNKIICVDPEHYVFLLKHGIKTTYNISEGVSKIIQILDFIKSDKKVLVVDDIDAYINYNILIDLIKMIKKSNKQLICTVRDSKFFDLNIFRRDEIYMIDRIDNHSDSKLYSLINFEYENKENLFCENGLLEGRFCHF